VSWAMRAVVRDLSDSLSPTIEDGSKDCVSHQSCQGCLSEMGRIQSTLEREN
jgi:hypothetical protein